MKSKGSKAFNICIAGEPDKNANEKKLLNHLYTAFRVIEQELKAVGGEICFISSARVYNDFWQRFIEKCGYTVTLNDAIFDEKEKVRSADVLVATLRNMTEFADMMLMVWDENTESQGGIPWEMLRISHKKDIPCIWFSMEGSKPYWAQQVYYGKYSIDSLRRYINRVYIKAPDSKPKEKSVGFMKIGAKLYNRFLKKFKAESLAIASKGDAVMEKDYSYSGHNQERTKLRNCLLDKFTDYDKQAIDYSEKYTASIYLRAILPMLSTVPVAVGFYVEAVLGFFFDTNIGGLSLWSLIAATGFGLYLFVNVFVYILSKNPTINLWHRSFIKNRTIAEILRVMVHFLPLGIYVDATSSLGRYDSMTLEEQEAYSEIRNILRSENLCVSDFSEKGKEEILHSANMLCDDQIYYLRRTKKRYENIIAHLKKWSTIIFSLSTVLLFVRTVYQILYTLNVFEFMSHIHLPYGNVDALNFTTGMLNLLALILPAWGSFFTTKLQLCNFENLYNTYDAKEEGLIAMSHRICELESRSNVPVNTIYDVADELVELLLSETKTWGNSMKKKKFTKL